MLKFMLINGIIGMMKVSKSASLELCLDIFIMILNMRDCVKWSKKSIYYKIIAMAPLLKTAAGFSFDIISNAKIQASEISI